jgi:hypothetical protein
VRWIATTVCAAGGVALLVLARALDAPWFERHMLLPWYYPWAPAFLPGWFRLATAVAGAALLAACWPLGKLAARATFAGCARVAVAVVLALGASELILRRADRGTTAWRAPKLEFRIGRPDARFGWVMLPSRATVLGPRERPVLYAVDGWGDRAASERTLPDPAAPSLVVSGESIAVGHGVAYEDTFPALMGKDLGLQVVNVACGGYGSDQALLRLDDALVRLQRPVAAVTTFVPVMLSRNLQDYRPRLALRQGALTLVPPAEGLFGRLRVRDLLVNEMPYSGEQALRKSMRLTAEILRETARSTRAHGAEPLFAIFSIGPQRAPDAHPEWWVVRELFVVQGLPYALIDLDPSELLPGDGHPDPAAHRRIATALEKALRGAAPSSRSPCGGCRTSAPPAAAPLR